MMSGKTHTIGHLLICTLLLLSAALYNGYPLVYSDTGTYIISGFTRMLPNDRPITYGLFIWLTSGGGLSLWLTIAVQCLWTAWILQQVMARVAETLPMPLMVGLLCSLTPLPWYAGQLMPDIFTPIQVLLVVEMLLASQLSRWQLGVRLAMFLFCCLAHFSNLFIGLITLSLVAAYLYFTKKGEKTTYLRLSILGLSGLLAFVAMPALNYAVGKEWVLSKGGHTFLMGRMIDSGMLKQYLDDHCATENYRLCAYKDSLPVNSRLFHWEANSPLTLEGGWGNPATEDEYRRIVRGTLTSPKYIALHVWESLVATPMQLMQNATGSGLDYKWYRSPASPPWQAVQQWFPHEHNEYRFSRQCGNLWKQEIDFAFFNRLLFWVLLGSVLVLGWDYYRGATWPAAWSLVLVVMAMGILSNAFVTASLGSICDRFPSRVVWFVPFWALLVLSRRFDFFKNS